MIPINGEASLTWGVTTRPKPRERKDLTHPLLKKDRQPNSYKLAYLKN